jgi:hypothetical protein
MISKDFTFKTWQEIEPFYLQLQEKNINSSDELYAWFVDRSILESFLSENLAWRYIRQTCNTSDADLQKELDFFIEEIQPQIASFTNKLNQKALNSPFLDILTRISRRWELWCVVCANKQKFLEKKISLFWHKFSQKNVSMAVLQEKCL